MENKKLALLLYLGIWLLAIISLMVFWDERGDSSTGTTVAQLTPTPTVTRNAAATSIPHPTLAPTQTLSPTPSRTPRPTRTPIPTPIPSALPVIELGTGSVAYQLKRPDPQILLNVLYNSFIASGDHSTTDSDPPFYRQFLDENAIYAQRRVIDHDLETYYSDGFPLAGQLLDVFDTQEIYSPFPVTGVTTLLYEAIREYFLHDNPVLSSGMPVELNGWGYTPYTIQFDKDNDPEWIIKADVSHSNTSFYLGFDQSEAGTLVFLPQEKITDALHDYGSFQIHLDQDLTGDGIPELVFSTRRYIGGSATLSFVDVVTWQEGRLQALETIELSYYYGLHTMYDIADYTGDGVADIRVLTPHEENFNCVWDEADIYSWDGFNRQPLMSDGLPPDTPWCNVWRGFGGVTTDPIFLYSEGTTLQEQIAFLEKALTQFAQEQFPPVELMALVRVRLAMMYGLEDRLAEAQTTLEAIATLPQDKPFIQIVQENYEATSGSLWSFCRALIADANQMLDTEIGPYVNTALIRNNPWPYTPFLPFVCPLRGIALTQFSQATLTKGISPVQAAANMGLEIVLYQQANLDDDPEWEGIGILEPTDPTLVIFDPTTDTWEFFSVVGFINPVTTLEIATLDITQDALPEIIVALTFDTSEDTEPDFASENEVGILLHEEDGFTLGWPHYPDEMPVLEELDGEFFGLVPSSESGTTTPGRGPYWYFLRNFPITTDSSPIMYYLDDLQSAVLEQSRPQTIPDEIMACLDYLPTDDWDVQQLRYRLLFLLGYNYELAGETEEAIAVYLSLIQQAPQSPWSWLAWARLEPVPAE